MEEGERGGLVSGYNSPWSLRRQNYKDGAKNVGKLEPRPTTWYENVSHAPGTRVSAKHVRQPHDGPLRRSIAVLRARLGGSETFKDIIISPAWRTAPQRQSQGQYRGCPHRACTSRKKKDHPLRRQVGCLQTQDLTH